jgi:zinc protease
MHRFLRRTVLALAVVTAVAPVPARAQRATLEKLVKRLKLPNGLDVIVLENHAVPIATADIIFHGGAMSQEPNDQGVPHLFEHMLFKGFSGGVRTFSNEAANLHAAYNGETGEESVSYYLTLPSEKVDKAIELLSTLVRDPHFDNDALQTERHVVFGEFNRNESNQRFLLGREVDRRLWGQSFYRKNTLGEALPMLQVDPRRLSEIYKQYYVPNNAALIVTGDVVPERVFEAAAKRFGTWKTAPDPFIAHPVPAMEPLTKTAVAVLEGDVEHITLEIAWQGPSVRGDAAATFAADAMASVVNDEDSRFQKNLVDAGYFQTAGLSYSTLDHTGPITFIGTTTMPQLANALTALESELRMMAAPEYFTVEELEAAKKRRAVSTVLQLEQGAGLAQSIGFWWAVSGLDYYFDYVDNLSTRTPADLNAFVVKYIFKKPYVAGVLTTPKDGAQVDNYMKQFIELTEDR